MTRGDVGDRRRDAIRQLDHLNLVASRLGLWLEGRALDLDQGRLSGFGDPLVPLEEIGCADRREDVVEIVAEDEVPVHADHSIGIAIEEDEFEVADFAGGVGDAVIEDDGIGTGFSCCYQAKFVVPRARRVPDDESKAAYGDGKACDEHGRREGAGPGEESNDPRVVVGEGPHCKFAIEKVGDVEDQKSAGYPTNEEIFPALVHEQRQRYSKRKPCDPNDFFECDPCCQNQTGIVHRSQAGL